MNTQIEPYRTKLYYIILLSRELPQTTNEGFQIYHFNEVNRRIALYGRLQDGYHDETRQRTKENRSLYSVQVMRALLTGAGIRWGSVEERGKCSPGETGTGEQAGETGPWQLYCCWLFTFSFLLMYIFKYYIGHCDTILFCVHLLYIWMTIKSKDNKVLVSLMQCKSFDAHIYSRQQNDDDNSLLKECLNYDTSFIFQNCHFITAIWNINMFFSKCVLAIFIQKLTITVIKPLDNRLLWQFF